MSTGVATAFPLLPRLRIQNGFYVQPAVGRDTSINSDDDERRRAAHLFRPRNAGQQEAPETRGPTLLGEQRGAGMNEAQHRSNFNQVSPSSLKHLINEFCLNVNSALLSNCLF